MVQLPLEPPETPLPPSPITHTPDRLLALPETEEDWGQWVSASRTRNFALGDPILDWFEAFGRDRGFMPDDAVDGYDPRTEFAPFIMGKGNEFEAALIRHVSTLADVREIHTEGEGRNRSRDLDAARATLDAMREGAPLIYQGVLRDPVSRTYGSPDLLIRSNEMIRLFPGGLTEEQASVGAPELGDRPWHYRIVDIKFTTLSLLARGAVGNSGSSPAYKIQLFIYNRALGRLQGYEPDSAFILGRGWRQRLRGVDDSSQNAMDRLGPVAMDPPLSVETDAAVDWMRRLRRDGHEWTPLPTPTVPELWPNMKADADFPWHEAKKEIADKLDDLTLLWWVGKDKRDAAVKAGLTRWTDPRVTPASVGVTGVTTEPTLRRVLEVNRAEDGPLVAPGQVHAAEDQWRPKPSVEFYVDFEYVSNVNDDFSRIPEQNGQPLIFMIGCGHEEDGRWVFRNFTTDRLTEDDEARTIDAWLQHMGDVAASRSASAKGRVIHWSFAEPVNYEVAYDSARNRHPEKGWPSLDWFDLWQKVFKDEPVVVKGSLSFGLKTVARAMHEHGLIATSWGDSQVDGLGAMVGAWACDAQARESGLASMREIGLMDEITKYNEVDCRVMWEILRYLREHH